MYEFSHVIAINVIMVYERSLFMFLLLNDLIIWFGIDLFKNAKKAINRFYSMYKFGGFK